MAIVYLGGWYMTRTRASWHWGRGGARIKTNVHFRGCGHGGQAEKVRQADGAGYEWRPRNIAQNQTHVVGTTGNASTEQQLLIGGRYFTMYLQPWTELGIWFHDLPLRATIRGAILATGAGTIPAGMRMVIAYESAPGEYTAVTTLGMGTSQEGEAMTVLLCVGQLASQQGTY